MNRTARVRVRWQAPEPSRQLLQALAEDRMVIVGDDDLCDVLVTVSGPWSQTASAVAEARGAPVLVLVPDSSSHDLEGLLERLPEQIAVEPDRLSPQLLVRRLRQLVRTTGADQDTLTGLMHRPALLSWLDDGPPETVGLVVVGLDRFASLNDRLGYEGGDRIITEVAARLESVAPNGAAVARLEGDAFAVAVPSPETDLLLMAEFVRRSAQIAGGPGGPPALAELSISAGCAIGQRGDSARLVAQARTALLGARVRGGARTMTYADYVAEVPPGQLEAKIMADAISLSSTWFFEKVSEQTSAVINRLRDEADRDPITGLANRTCLDRELSQELVLAVQRGEPLALAFVDVDDFKSVNTRFGWYVGDAVLRHVGTTMRHVVGDRGWVAKYGGDEFCVVLPGSDLASAEVIVREVVTAVSVDDFATADRRVLPVCVSAGVAPAMPGDGLEQIFRRAQPWTQRAKNLGRNRVEVWEDGVDPLAT